MAFNIGQLRRSEISSYSTDISYSQRLIETKNIILTFHDQSLLLRGANIVNSLYTYYLKFKVKQMVNCTQEFTVKLQSDEIEIDNSQNVRVLKVQQGNQDTTFEIIFNPNATYNQIVFELSRLLLDFYMYDEATGINGRVMNIEILEFVRLNNVVTSYLARKFAGLTGLKKIGIQGPPGLLFTIDGEEMRIGRSGIYELYNEDIVVSYVGFVIKDSLFTQDGKDYFIMDFKY